MSAAEDANRPLVLRELPTVEVAGLTVVPDGDAAALVERLIAREADLLGRFAAE
ncbi:MULTISPECIES: hypothetical protein [unclassified Rathayibacter]|uniref:hypothetical protein n=1 Tax=unclassified Rathayibacter TaxID=2609250 RepID=UPI00141709ED|nr:MULTISPECIES: hypothetical protein [unclassified Rathayibacter]